MNQTNICLDAMTLPWLEQNLDYMKLDKTFNLSHVKEVAFDDVQICWKRLLIYLNRFCYINSTSHKLSVENTPSTIKNVNLDMQSLLCFNWKPRDVRLCYTATRPLKTFTEISKRIFNYPSTLQHASKERRI